MYFENVQKYKDNQRAFNSKRDSIPSPLLVDLLSKERVGVAPTIGMANMMQQQSQQAQQAYAAGGI